jgi:hypothetical protein
VPRRAIGAASSHPPAGWRFAPSHHANAAGMSRRKLRFLRSMRLIRRPVQEENDDYVLSQICHRSLQDQ